MRSNAWLHEKLQDLLGRHFSDVERTNEILICFGRAAKRRYGSIKLSHDKKKSHIRVNGLFRDERIPEQIICATIVHELCHYSHGFCSPLERKFKHPHSGGVIAREFEERGLYELHRFEKEWSKKVWPEIVREAFPNRRRLHERVRRSFRAKRSMLGKRSTLIKLLFDFLEP